MRWSSFNVSRRSLCARSRLKAALAPLEAASRTGSRYCRCHQTEVFNRLKGEQFSIRWDLWFYTTSVQLSSWQHGLEVLARTQPHCIQPQHAEDLCGRWAPTARDYTAGIREGASQALSRHRTGLCPAGSSAAPSDRLCRRGTRHYSCSSRRT